MRKALLHILAVVTAFSGLVSCVPDEYPEPYTSYAYLADGTGSSSAVISNQEEKLVSSLSVTISIDMEDFKSPISVYYDLKVGNGLKEGVDFELDKKTSSPIVFKPGSFSMPLNITWFRNPDLDPAKDNSLEVKLTGSDMSSMKMGQPGGYKSSFVFTKR